jgi:hypothetical protein
MMVTSTSIAAASGILIFLDPLLFILSLPSGISLRASLVQDPGPGCASNGFCRMGNPCPPGRATDLPEAQPDEFCS